jgi:hypothetical protein
VCSSLLQQAFSQAKMSSTDETLTPVGRIHMEVNNLPSDLRQALLAALKEEERQRGVAEQTLQRLDDLLLQPIQWGSRLSGIQSCGRNALASNFPEHYHQMLLLLARQSHPNLVARMEALRPNYVDLAVFATPMSMPVFLDFPYPLTEESWQKFIDARKATVPVEVGPTPEEILFFKPDIIASLYFNFSKKQAHFQAEQTLGFLETIFTCDVRYTCRGLLLNEWKTYSSGGVYEYQDAIEGWTKVGELFLERLNSIHRNSSFHLEGVKVADNICLKHNFPWMADLPGILDEERFTRFVEQWVSQNPICKPTPKDFTCVRPDRLAALYPAYFAAMQPIPVLLSKGFELDQVEEFASALAKRTDADQQFARFVSAFFQSKPNSVESGSALASTP